MITLMLVLAAAAPGVPGTPQATPATQATQIPQAPPPALVTAPLVPDCKKKAAGDEIVVCGPAQSPYRIDPTTLSVMRAHDAQPPKPPVDANAAIASGNGCVGPSTCKGDMVPLVAMALTALKAAELAAKGDDWREAIRTHADDYRLYQDAQRRQHDARKPRIGVGISK